MQTAKTDQTEHLSLKHTGHFVGFVMLQLSFDTLHWALSSSQNGQWRAQASVPGLDTLTYTLLF